MSAEELFTLVSGKLVTNVEENPSAIELLDKVSTVSFIVFSFFPFLTFFFHSRWRIMRRMMRNYRGEIKLKALMGKMIVLMSFLLKAFVNDQKIFPHRLPINNFQSLIFLIIYLDLCVMWNFDIMF